MDASPAQGGNVATPVRAHSPDRARQAPREIAHLRHRRGTQEAAATPAAGSGAGRVTGEEQGRNRRPTHEKQAMQNILLLHPRGVNVYTPARGFQRLTHSGSLKGVSSRSRSRSRKARAPCLNAYVGFFTSGRWSISDGPAIIGVEANRMEKSVGAQPPADEATDWEAAIKQIFEEIEQSDIRIRGYQAEIDQLKVETRAMLAQMKEQLQGAV